LLFASLPASSGAAPVLKPLQTISENHIVNQ